jgi:hypothetical protein
MSEPVDIKTLHAEVGRTSLYKAMHQSAGMNMMEKQYQQVLGDLKVREQITGMAGEVEHLPEVEKLAEVLSRFVVALLMQTQGQQQGMIFWHLYLHLRATGLIDAVKPNIGSLVGLDGKRIPPKEGN